jgi:hypothetical protein
MEGDVVKPFKGAQSFPAKKRPILKIKNREFDENRTGMYQEAEASPFFLTDMPSLTQANNNLDRAA